MLIYMGDLMGLFEKFFEPGYMVLNDFDKNYEFNKRKMKEYIDRFRKDNQKFICCITDEFEDAVNQWKIDKEYLKNISGSEFFSRYIAIMMQNLKVYNMYFRSLDNSKRKKEVNKIVAKLIDTYDVLVFVLVTFLRYEKNQNVYFECKSTRTIEGGKFLYNPSDESKRYIDFIVKLMNSAVLLINAMRENDNTKMHKEFQTVSNLNIINELTEDPFEL